MTALIREARLGDEAQIERVRIATWRSSYKGVVPDHFLAGLRPNAGEKRWRERLAAPPAGQRVFVAVNAANEILGFSIVLHRQMAELPYDCELDGLYVHGRHQGLGIGKQLLAASASWLLEQGCRSMFLETLRDGPARKFYESRGFTLLDRTRTKAFGKELVIVTYGIEDIARLLA